MNVNSLDIKCSHRVQFLVLMIINITMTMTICFIKANNKNITMNTHGNKIMIRMDNGFLIDHMNAKIKKIDKFN